MKEHMKMFDWVYMKRVGGAGDNAVIRLNPVTVECLGPGRRLLTGGSRR